MVTEYDGLIQAGGMAAALLVATAKYIAPIMDRWVTRHCAHMDKSDTALQEVGETLKGIDGRLLTVSDEVRELQRRVEDASVTLREVSIRCPGMPNSEHRLKVQGDNSQPRGNAA